MLQHVLPQWNHSTALASYPAKTINPKDFAHVVIDVQNYYCNKRRLFGTQHTEDIAGRIAETTTDLRNSGLRTIFVTVENDALDDTAKSLYMVEPDPERDLFVEKTAEDAFVTGNLDPALKSASVNGIVVSGFNVSSCVKDTVLSALEHGYSVIILSDCVGQGLKQEDTIPYHLADLQAAGAILMTSEQLLLAQKVPQFETQAATPPLEQQTYAIA